MPAVGVTEGFGSSMAAVLPHRRPRRSNRQGGPAGALVPDLADSARHRHQCRRWSAADVPSCSATPRPEGHTRRPGNVGGALRRGDRIECALGTAVRAGRRSRLAGDGIGPNAETEARGRRRTGGSAAGGVARLRPRGWEGWGGYGPSRKDRSRHISPMREDAAKILQKEKTLFLSGCISVSAQGEWAELHFTELEVRSAASACGPTRTARSG